MGECPPPLEETDTRLTAASVLSQKFDGAFGAQARTSRHL